jgi:LmbE family N-acetylglucosaminyl deacetylase
MRKLKLMCILVHPGDESLGTGGTLAKYNAEGFDYLSLKPAHRIAKLHYLTPPEPALKAYQAASSDLVMIVDDAKRRAVGWADWLVTTRVETLSYWTQIWRAVSCHQTQLSGYQVLRDLPDEHHQNLWGTQTFYRALSLVNGGRTVEDDLFAGLRANEMEDMRYALTYHQ